MRFLCINDGGELALSKNFTERVPLYAILSHTWGEEEDELTFQDFMQSTLPQKAGLTKLKFCANQASKDGLKYSWVDTCCINRFDLTELSEAITSMFRWYRDSAKCYTYLSDVVIPASTNPARSENWEPAFRSSRYWTRGWTLQELLAPKEVDFYSAEWAYLGGRATLVQQIQAATGIPAAALHGAAISSFSVDERLRWASSRVTKRPEDQAYCLLGIFDTSMSLRYGEGSHAFRRLLKNIEKSSMAERHSNGIDRNVADRILSSLAFPEIDSRKDQIQQVCKGTYDWMLQEHPLQGKPSPTFLAWLTDQSPLNKVYSISGKPGSGKSSIMAFLASYLAPKVNSDFPPKAFSIYFSSYFFWQPGHNELQKSVCGMLRTLIYNLLDQNVDHVYEVVALRRWRSAKENVTAMLQWTESELQETLKRCVKLIGKISPVLLLIDGLDECIDDSGDHTRLLTVVKEVAALPNTKICVSYRPQPIFVPLSGSGPILHLHQLNYNDIATYVKEILLNAGALTPSASSIPSGATMLARHVIERAEGVFLWAVLVVKDLCRAAMEGASLLDLEAILHNIPDDLAKYFERMLFSIKPGHRREASTMLQLALWQEPDFKSLQRLQLLDLAHITNCMNDAVCTPTDSNRLDLRSDREVYDTLETTSRRLQSRCKGMLRCYYDPNFLWPGNEQVISILRISGVEYKTPLLPTWSTLPNDPLSAFGFRVEYLHRTLRDYLNTSEASQWLSTFTNGAITARRMLCGARIAAAEAVVEAQGDPKMVVFIASHVVAVLATPEMRSHLDTPLIFTRLWSVLQYALSRPGWLTSLSFLYITSSIDEWEDEKITPLSLAVDFEIDIVVQQLMTAGAIRDQIYRPLLDHALRPRFFTSLGLNIGLRTPSFSYVKRMLSLGADLNAPWEATTVFSAYLCFMMDYFIAVRSKLPPEYLDQPQNAITTIRQDTSHAGQSGLAPEVLDQLRSITELLIQNGAARWLRYSWLGTDGKYRTYNGMWAYHLQSLDEEQVFCLRWPGLRTSSISWMVERNTHCQLSTLLAYFRPWFGDDYVAHLQSLTSSSTT